MLALKLGEPSTNNTIQRAQRPVLGYVLYGLVLLAQISKQAGFTCDIQSTPGYIPLNHNRRCHKILCQEVSGKLPYLMSKRWFIQWSHSTFLFKSWSVLQTKPSRIQFLEQNYTFLIATQSCHGTTVPRPYMEPQ